MISAWYIKLDPLGGARGRGGDGGASGGLGGGGRGGGGEGGEGGVGGPGCKQEAQSKLSDIDAKPNSWAPRLGCNVCMYSGS